MKDNEAIVRPVQDAEYWAQRIDEEFDRVNKSVKKTLEQARVLGECLKAAKRCVGHGKWQKWLEKNCKVKYRQCSSYIRVAENWTEIQSNVQSTALLGIDGALDLVKKPKGEGSSNVQSTAHLVNGVISEPSKKSKTQTVESGESKTRGTTKTKETSKLTAPKTTKGKTSKTKPNSKNPPKPSPKVSAESLANQAIKTYCSPLIRLVDKVAAANGGQGKNWEEFNEGMNKCLKSLEAMKAGEK